MGYCGWLLDFFAVESGIWQGCLIFSLAFVLAVELLASKIRDCKLSLRLLCMPVILI